MLLVGYAVGAYQITYVQGDPRAGGHSRSLCSLSLDRSSSLMSICPWLPSPPADTKIGGSSTAVRASASFAVGGFSLVTWRPSRSNSQLSPIACP